jgi:hypothetical protein
VEKRTIKAKRVDIMTTLFIMILAILALLAIGKFIIMVAILAFRLVYIIVAAFLTFIIGSAIIITIWIAIHGWVFSI